MPSRHLRVLIVLALIVREVEASFGLHPDGQKCGATKKCKPPRMCLHGKECVCPVAFDGPDCKERHASLPSCAGTHPDAGAGTWFNVNVREVHNFTTCAVVGGASVEKDWGADIDSHAAVIRFNGSPTVGFESKVGRKTTLRVQNRQYCGFAEQGEWCVYYTKARREHKGVNERCSELFNKPSKFGGSQCKELDPNPGARHYANDYWQQFPHPPSDHPVPTCTSKEKSLLHLMFNLDQTLAARQAALRRLDEGEADADSGGRALLQASAGRGRSGRKGIVGAAVKGIKSRRSAAEQREQLLKSVAYLSDVKRKVDAGEVVAPKCTQSKSSTGFYGIMLAVQLCAEVNVYLFTGTPDHYYNKCGGRRIPQTKAHAAMLAFEDRHDWLSEKTCMHLVAEMPNVHFHDTLHELPTSKPNARRSKRGLLG